MASELDFDKVRPLDEQAEFVMSFVDEAQEDRQPFDDIWDEVESNWLVRPLHDRNLSSHTRYPLAGSLRDFQGGHTSSGRAILKDPETHQAVMSIVSSIILSIAPEKGFIRAKRRGFEDIYKAKTVNGLLEYNFQLEGQFWAMFEWLLGAGIYGTGIAESFWDFVEEPREFRTVEVDPTTLQEFTNTQILTAPVWDDPRMEAFDIRDFYHDTGASHLHRMKGAARRFSITATQALLRADREVYKKAAVRDAIDRRQTKMRKEREEEGVTDDVTGLNNMMESHPEFMEMNAFRYCGETPFKSAGDPWTRREIVVVNGVTVRSEVWPRRLPWFECKITPRLGSFYGVSPGELIRFDQDFADTLKMMLADAVVRSVHPPNIYDRNAGVDVAKLRRFDPSVPIPADRVDAIQQVPYNPPVQPAFAMYSGIKEQMRQGSSATDVNQGFGIGTKRLSASEALATTQRAGVRPEMFNRVMEQEYLPPLGKYNLGLYQSHLEDTEDLANRIGESESVVALGDILEDFDIHFIGSRVEGTREQDLQAFREIITFAATPFAQLVPWIPLLREFFSKLGQDEIASMVGNPQLIQLNTLLTQLSGPNQLGGNANGTTPNAPSPGALPAQNFGGPQ